MRPSRRVGLIATAALLLAPLPALALGSASPSAAKLQPWLAGQLRVVPASAPLRVMVSGREPGDAKRAVLRAGLSLQQSWDLAGIAVGIGLPAQIRTLSVRPGVTYVEGDQPLSYTLDTAHKATRSDVARARLRTPQGKTIDGAGITIAVIDSGIDQTHPFFNQGGTSKVVQNRKNVCGLDPEVEPTSSEACFAPMPDADTASVGGHGTHVAGIAAGVVTKTTGATPLTIRGAASGAKLVGLSVGAAISLIDAAAAQNWVLEHQFRPCRPASEQNGPLEPACPPIRVTNHSYGPSGTAQGGNRFNSGSADVRLQRLLVQRGVVAVWAAGNSGGTGSIATTNPPGMDETPGILMVANYDDKGIGDRNANLAGSSSRGREDDSTTYPDLSAPGTRILSSCRPYLAICSSGRAPVNGPAATDVATFNVISGTSMASPYVAGVVAQLFQANPRLRPADVERILEDTAHRFTAGADYVRDDPERNTRTLTSYDKGHGLVDVNAALTAALRFR